MSVDITPTWVVTISTAKAVDFGPGEKILKKGLTSNSTSAIIVIERERR
jgi:hypothetical protein